MSPKRALSSESRPRYSQGTHGTKRVRPNIWVATCLETGYIATGLGYNEARDNVLNVLRTETIYAQENGRKLRTRSPIPAVLEKKWETVTREHPPQTIPLFPPDHNKRQQGESRTKKPLPWLGLSDDISDVGFAAFLQIMHKHCSELVYSREAVHYARFHRANANALDSDFQSYPIIAENRERLSVTNK